MTHTADALGSLEIRAALTMVMSQDAQVKPDALGSKRVARPITTINRRAKARPDVVGITIHNLALA